MKNSTELYDDLEKDLKEPLLITEEQKSPEVKKEDEAPLSSLTLNSSASLFSTRNQKNLKKQSEDEEEDDLLPSTPGWSSPPIEERPSFSLFSSCYKNMESLKNTFSCSNERGRFICCLLTMIAAITMVGYFLTNNLNDDKQAVSKNRSLAP